VWEQGAGDRAGHNDAAAESRASRRFSYLGLLLVATDLPGQARGASEGRNKGRAS
jgi:light-regulated signal transduction histidine kinase (bacteriophytochrome)